MVKRGFIKVNFIGGIISPGALKRILLAAKKAAITQVSFGLRQQLILETGTENYFDLRETLYDLNLPFEENVVNLPNIVSSYPAVEAFINKTWLSEGIYKDIFDLVDYTPKLKINISDSNQSFTPLYTGNINWVASSSTHFWHVFVRFPKTNSIYEWKETVYTNDVVAVSKKIEEIIFNNPSLFIRNEEANGDLLFKMMLETGHYNTKPSETLVQPMDFRLPYYEGFNRYNSNFFWLGIYRRDELFDVDFLLEICDLCLQTKVGQLCSTPWKSLMVKGIEDKVRYLWDVILAKYLINVRHAANELNFQVEDFSKSALNLKQYIVKHFSKDDIRTFAICFGIKTRTKSEIFSSILIKRRALLTFGEREFFFVYDILCAQDFNPNERTGYVFRKNILKYFLPKELKNAAKEFYQFKTKSADEVVFAPKKEKEVEESIASHVYQCPNCFTVYDPAFGDVDNGIVAGTQFHDLPSGYCCSLCETAKKDFNEIAKSSLGVQIS
ncbi:MAG: rubredoxin [Bacteroidetes bacterium]|nr:rubredoxin [Bacteroidota bacterium]